MPTDSLTTLLAVWQVFQPYVTRPSFEKLLVIATGWILTTCRTRAITEALVVTRVAGRRHHEAFHRFFSRGTWEPDTLGLALLWRLHRQGFPLRLLLDDTVNSKKGALVYGICSHLDPVRSTKAFRVFTFGHCWVVLCLVVDVPFSRRPWALPILFRLYRTKKDCAAKNIPYRKKTELGRELVDIVAAHYPCERIEIAADCAYCNSTLTKALADNVVLFGTMRPDAVLTDAPSADKRPHCRGRRPVRGVGLPKPEQVAADPDVPWHQCQALLYRQVRTVQYKVIRAQWYRGTGTRMLLIVITRCWSGKIPWRVYFCTDPSVTVPQLLESYARRWSIEVAFRELKQLFGFGDSCARSKNAVLRTAPFVGLLYTSLVIWFIEGAHQSHLASPPVRPWYTHKRGLCFNDILRAARRTLARSDILDPLCNFDNLQQFRSPPSQPRRTQHRTAA